MEPYKEKCLFWHWIWIDCGKPHEEAIAQVMRSARAWYDKTVKDVKKRNVNLEEGEWQRQSEIITSAIYGKK